MNKVEYWLDIAEYDFQTAQAMYDTKRWLYVGFMCHQVLEKTLKAYWCSTQPEDPPYTHNLVRLINGSGLKMSESQLSFIDIMTPMNIEARYPQYKNALAQMLDEPHCKDIINRTNQLREWIKNKL